MTMSQNSFFDDFLHQQDDVHRHLLESAELAERQGLVPDTAVTKRQGGYVFFLRPSVQVVKLLDSLSSQLVLFAGMKPYYGGQLYVPLYVCRESDNFSLPDDHTFVLDALRRIVQSCHHQIRIEKKSPTILWKQFVLTNTELFLCGRIDLSFSRACRFLERATEEYGLGGSIHWNASVKVGYSTLQCGRGLVAHIRELLKYFDTLLPANVQTFSSIGVGWFGQGERIYGLHTLEEYQL
jgi:hypothetical protein